MKYTLNGILILTPYKKAKELEAKQVATGFAMTANKIGVENLELLVDAKLFIGDNEQVLKSGTKIFFKEVLDVQKWPRSVYESEEFPQGFIIGNASDILYIEE